MLRQSLMKREPKFLVGPPPTKRRRLSEQSQRETLRNTEVPDKRWETPPVQIRYRKHEQPKLQRERILPEENPVEQQEHYIVFDSVTECQLEENDCNLPAKGFLFFVLCIAISATPSAFSFPTDSQSEQ